MFLTKSVSEKPSKYGDQLQDVLTTLKCSPQPPNKDIQETKMRRTLNGRMRQNLQPLKTRQNRSKTDDYVMRHITKPTQRTLKNQGLKALGLFPTLQKLDEEAEKEREFQRVISKLKLGKNTTNCRAVKSTRSLFDRHNLSLGKLKLRKLDADTEKERELQRVMSNLKGHKNTSNYNSATTSSRCKDSCVSRSGMELTSGLYEEHKLTLKQLREFWSEMPSFLNIHAASLRQKYGVYDNDGNDIDDLSIDIVRKFNQPSKTGKFPRLDVKGQYTDRKLDAIQEELV